MQWFIEKRDLAQITVSLALLLGNFGWILMNCYNWNKMECGISCFYVVLINRVWKWTFWKCLCSFKMLCAVLSLFIINCTSVIPSLWPTFESAQTKFHCIWRRGGLTTSVDHNDKKEWVPCGVNTIVHLSCLWRNAESRRKLTFRSTRPSSEWKMTYPLD